MQQNAIWPTLEWKCPLAEDFKHYTTPVIFPAKQYSICATVSCRLRILLWCSVLQCGEFQATPNGQHLASCATATTEVSMGQHDTGVHSSASDSQWVLIKENHSYEISKYYPVILLQTLTMCKG